MYKIVFQIIYIILIFASLGFGQNSRENFSEKRLVYRDCEVSYELVVLSVTHLVGHIFIVAEDKYFNEKDLSVLFRCLSKKYPEFATLKITVFSDRDNLEVAIRGHFNPPPDIDPPIDISEDNCKNFQEARKPCPLGYFRAIYFRFDGKEFFDFSEDRNKVPLKRINLQR